MNPQDSNVQKSIDSVPELTICIELPFDQEKPPTSSSNGKTNTPQWMDNFRHRRLFLKPKKLNKGSVVAKKNPKYEELVRYIFQYQRFCEENRKTFPMKNFTPNCVWFLISALYFSREDYILKGLTPENVFENTVEAISAVSFGFKTRLQQEDLAENSMRDDLFLAEMKRQRKASKSSFLDEIVDDMETELKKQSEINRNSFEDIHAKMRREYEYLSPIMDFANKSPFNILMNLDNTSRREKEFFDYLESKQQDPKGFTLESLRTTKNSKMMEPHDVVCQVCNDGDFTDDNLIVFCSLCSNTVHQKCYELNHIPETDWICDLCAEFGPVLAKNMRCPLCSRRGGAMKPTSLNITECIFSNLNQNFHDFQLKCIKNINEDKEDELVLHESSGKGTDDTKEEPNPKNIWVHLSCALWLPEIYFDENLSKCNIKGLEAVEEWRYSISCGVCRMKKIGAIVQCSGFRCTNFYHVECARRVGMYLEIIELKYLLYCDKHIPLKLKRIIVSRSCKARDEILKYFGSLKRIIYGYKYEMEMKFGSKAKEHGFNDILKKKSKSKSRSPCNEFIINLRKLGSNGYKVTGVKTPYNKDFVQKQFNLRKINRNNVQKFFKKTSTCFLNAKFLQKRYRRLAKAKKLNQQRKLEKTKATKLYKNFSKNLDVPKAKQRLAKKKSNFIRKKGTKDPEFEFLPRLNSTVDEEREVIEICQEEEEVKNKTCDESAEVQILEFFPEEYSHKNTNDSSNDEKLYCICQRRYDGLENMISCFVCEEWFHFKCIGFKGSIKDAEGVKFVCKSCDEHQNLQQRRNRRNDYSRFFENYYEEIDDLNIKNEKKFEKKIEKKFEKKFDKIEKKVDNEVQKLPVMQIKNKGMKKNLGYNILRKWGTQQDKEYQEIITQEIDNFSDGVNELDNMRKVIKIS